MAAQMRDFGEVAIAAPATEQSGVGHSITFRTPLIAQSVHRDGRHWAWAVEGSPADCTKLAVAELCKDSPIELVVSGINSGLNAGINVLYSGTVAAAVEGAFFGLTSIAVSLEFDEDADYEAAAAIAYPMITRIAGDADCRGGLFNINIATETCRRYRRGEPIEHAVCPMGQVQYGRSFEKRTDPDGNPYYWSTSSPPEAEPSGEVDLSQVFEGKVTLTPLQFDLTHPDRLKQLRTWKFASPKVSADGT